MNCEIEILNSALSSIKDNGRYGYRNIGVPYSGAQDIKLLSIANHLLGNDVYKAAIEFQLAGLRLKLLKGKISLSIAGDYEIDIIRNTNEQRLENSKFRQPSYSSFVLYSGDELNIKKSISGNTGYLAIKGEVEADKILGSFSTYNLSSFGGFKGRYLKKGDIIKLNKTSIIDNDKILNNPPKVLTFDKNNVCTLRVLLGPQITSFSANIIKRFFSTVFEITPQSDSMGMRLKGDNISHKTKEHADILSDAIIPGSIQIPGNEQSIILLNDCQTIGGYPKIAAVIYEDLRILAQLKAGDKILFKEVSLEEADEISIAEQKSCKSLLAQIQEYSYKNNFDLNMLISQNLISGVTNGELD